jgi:hypothetical protein
MLSAVYGGGAVCFNGLKFLVEFVSEESRSLPAGERATLSCNTKEWVRGFGSIGAAGNPLTPTLSPNGERERTEFGTFMRSI